MVFFHFSLTFFPFNHSLAGKFYCFLLVSGFHCLLVAIFRSVAINKTLPRIFCGCPFFDYHFKIYWFLVITDLACLWKNTQNMTFYAHPFRKFRIVLSKSKRIIKVAECALVLSIGKQSTLFSELEHESDLRESIDRHSEYNE